jgi:hypothetical protein
MTIDGITTAPNPGTDIAGNHSSFYAPGAGFSLFQAAPPPPALRALSTLAMTIGVMELTYQARQVESYTFKGFEAFSAATVVYVVISLVITFAVNLYNDKVLNIHRAG